MITLSSRASQPMAQSKTGDFASICCFKLGKDNSPFAFRICQTAPAVVPISPCICAPAIQGGLDGWRFALETRAAHPIENRTDAQSLARSPKGLGERLRGRGERWPKIAFGC